MAKGYSLDALVNEHYMKSSTALDTANLNTYTGMDNVGVFYQKRNENATEANGYPPGAQAGTLEVIPTNANSVGRVTQRYTNWQNLRMWVRGQNDGRLDNLNFSNWVELINANNIYNAIYPIGIVLQFDNATNPNNTFTGTVWEQITDGRSVRAATVPEMGSELGQIGAKIGSDTVTIGVANMPVHNHSFSATSSSTDLGTKTSSTHDYGSKTTSSFDYGTKSASNFDYGTKTTNNTGAHTHSVQGTVGDPGPNWHLNWETSNNDDYKNQNTSSAGAHAHTVAIGAHSHTVGIGAHTHTVSIGTHNHTTVMGAHTHTVNGTTDNAGGTTELNVRNASRYYALWKRVA